MNIRKLTIVFFTFTSLVFYAQNSVSIDKTAFLEKVKSENSTLKKSIKDIEKAKADYQQSAAVFLPNIGISHTAILTTNPLMAFGSILNQGIVTQNDFNPALLNDPDETRNFATIIQVQQPLINVDGFYQRKAVKNALQATELKASRTQDYILLEAEKAYMNLQVSYQYKEVLEKANDFVAKLMQQTENYFKEGLIQKTDVLSVKVRALEIKNKLQKAESQIANASNYVSFLMNETSNTLLQPSDSLTMRSFSDITHQELPNSRADIQALEFATKANEQLYNSSKMSYLPRLNAFGSYELYDDAIFQGGANGFVVGARLSWDLFKGSKRIGQVQKSKASFEQSLIEFEEYKAKSNLELAKAKRMLLDAENNVALTQLTLEQSKEILRIKNNRYNEGLEKIADVLQAETDVATKNLQYYQAVFEYNYTHNYIQFLTKQN